MLSCQSQSDFDIINIELNKDKVSTIIPKEIKTATFDAGLSGGNNKFTSISSKKILVFNGKNFAGKHPNAHSENSLFLFFNKQDSIITKYSVTLFTAKNDKKFIKTLKEALGNPNYTGFRTKKDKTDDKPLAYIWENKKNNSFYHLGVSRYENYNQLRLTVVPNPKNSQDIPAIYGSNCWSSFMYERTKRKNPNYTYQQFIIDAKKEDSDDVCSNLSK